MQKYIFSNGNEEIELKYVSAVEGLGIPLADVISTKRHGQDGEVVSSVTYQPRVFSLAFGIAGKNYLAATDERRRITRFFADKKPKTFWYRRENFAAYLYPVYLRDGYETGMTQSRLLPGIVQFVATDPWFKRDIAPTSAALETARLGWPAPNGLSWLAGGIPFSTAEKELVLVNHGDVDADTIIRFYGSAVTPYVHNLTTGLKITVNRTLGSTDILEINSATGRVDIISSDGTRNNAFNYITDASDFVNLAPGINAIEYGGAGGADGYLEIGGVEYYAGI
jgi:phage-related protein